MIEVRMTDPQRSAIILPSSTQNQRLVPRQPQKVSTDFGINGQRYIAKLVTPKNPFCSLKIRGLNVVFQAVDVVCFNGRPVTASSLIDLTAQYQSVWVFEKTSLVTLPHGIIGKVDKNEGAVWFGLCNTHTKTWMALVFVDCDRFNQQLISVVPTDKIALVPEGITEVVG